LVVRLGVIMHQKRLARGIFYKIDCPLVYTAISRHFGCVLLQKIASRVLQ
jgi:hypothetical protein